MTLIAGSHDAAGHDRFNVWLDDEELPRVSATHGDYAAEYADWQTVFGHRVWVDWTETIRPAP